MNTSLYNHNSFGSNLKPAIPNVIFKGLIHLIEVQDFEAANFILKNYTLTPFQNQFQQQKQNDVRSTNNNKHSKPL
jgi:hypothetical protein